MCKRILAAALVALLFNLICFAQGQSDPTPEQVKAAAKVRSKALDLGAGSHVRVRLHDRTEYKGYIVDLTFEGFVIEGGETLVPVRLTYYQIRDIKPITSRGRQIGAVAGYVLFFGIIVANVVGYARK